MRTVSGRRRGAARLLRVVLACWLVLPTTAEARQRIPDPLSPLDPVCRKGSGWISPDKVCHFTLSAVGAGGLYALGRTVGLGPTPAAVGAAVTVGVAGLLRETLNFGRSDKLLTQENFSRRDMVWNGLGIAVGLVVADQVVRRRRRDRPAEPEPSSTGSQPEAR